MGIYEVESNTCNCIGNFTTFDDDHRIYMSKPCQIHELKEGNTIYYDLRDDLKYIMKSFDEIEIKKKYLVKILKIEKIINSNKKIIKIEINDNLDTYFDDNKQIFYTQMNDEPMWKKVDDNKINMIILYKTVNHTVQDGWK